MRRHKHIQQLLYDYICNALAHDDRALVENHLRACTRCANELEEYRALVEIPFEHLRNAADARDAEFWKSFSSNVQRRIQSPDRRSEKSILEEWDALVSWLLERHRGVVLLAGAVATIAAVVVVWNPFTRVGVRQEVQPVTDTGQQLSDKASSQEIVRADERVGQYFRKSRALLVGLTNMKLDDDHSLDLTTEQSVSRELIHEARYLKNQPIDMRSAQLIGDLQGILIELANLKEEHDIPNVEIIRAGIHKENLLFKIRMAETRFDTSLSHMPIRSY